MVGEVGARLHKKFRDVQAAVGNDVIYRQPRREEVFSVMEARIERIGDAIFLRKVDAQ